MRFVAVILASLFLGLSAAAATAGDLEAKAKSLLVAFTEAVIEGPDAVAALLAPEYQIMRSNGVGFDRDGYVSKGVGAVSAGPEFAHEDIVATTSDDIMVVRYTLRINENHRRHGSGQECAQADRVPDD